MTKMNRGKGSRRRLRGVVMAEAAIVMMLLCLVTLGALQYGWFFYCLHTVTNAARQGARVEATLDGEGRGTAALEAALPRSLYDAATTRGVTGPFTDTADDPNLVYVQGQVFIDGNSPAVHLFPIPAMPVPNCTATVKMAKEGAN